MSHEIRSLRSEVSIWPAPTAPHPRPNRRRLRQDGLGSPGRKRSLRGKRCVRGGPVHLVRRFADPACPVGLGRAGALSRHRLAIPQKLLRSACRLAAAHCSEPASFHRAGRRSGVRGRAGGGGLNAAWPDAAGVAAEGHPPGRAAPVRERGGGAGGGLGGGGGGGGAGGGGGGGRGGGEATL